MPHVLAVASGFPEHYYTQEQLSAALREVWQQQQLEVTVFDRVQKSVTVSGRHLALPMERYRTLDFEAANRAWLETALSLGEQVLTQLFDRSGVAPEEVSLFASTTVTGIAVPSLEARLMNRLAFRPDTKRMPLFGLGCLAGTAGVARLHDYLVGHPREAAVLLSVELCSLTLQLGDLSVANLISSGLFGDGAAAVLMVGDEHPLAAGPATVASQSCFFPDSESVMGWEVTNRGLKIVLSPGVPEYARQVRPFAEQLLQTQGLTLADIHAWVTHPGGPKVIDALEESFTLPPGTLDHVRRSLNQHGNLSSSSVLLLLEQALSAPPPAPAHGLMLSMGPAFSAELLLLRWS